jgi:O-antigen/teichoic acid export membrane protein
VLFTEQALNAFKWSALGDASSRLIGPLIFLVLARLLLPEDFGIVAAATVVISFSQVFSDAGLAKALIQRQGHTDEAANAVFWINLALGVLIAGALFLLAPYVARFFSDQRIQAVTRVLSLQVVIAAFFSVHVALLQKALDFKRLFWIRLLTTLIPGIASIPLALSGYGYWALIAGTLAGYVAQGLLLWRLSSWRPKLSFNSGIAIELLAFGQWAMVSGIIGWFYVWMDALIVGHFLGAHDMGLYRVGNTFVSMIFGLVFAPMLPVLYSLFSRAQHDGEYIRTSLMSFARIAMLVAMPLVAVLVILHAPIERFLFGRTWEGLGVILAILAASQGLSWAVGANGEAYRAVGKPHLETWAMGLSVVIYLIGYLYSVQYGLVIFVTVRCILVLVGILAHAFIANHALRIPLSMWIHISYKPVVSIMLPLALLAFIGPGFSNLSVLTIAWQLAVVLIPYACMVWILERRSLLEPWRGPFNAA